MKRVALAAFLVVSASSAAAAPKAAPAPPGPSEALEGQELVLIGEEGARTEVALGCEGRSVLRRGGLVYVACGVAGVVVVDARGEGAPSVLERHAFGGPVAEVFEHGGQVWARVQRDEARPVHPGAGPLEPPLRCPAEIPVSEPGPAPKPEEAAEVVGAVASLGEGTVIVEFPEDAGLSRNDRVELFLEHEVDLGGGQKGTREESVAIGKVTAASERRASVDLGMNERVPKNARARGTTKGLSGSMWAPPRVSEAWELTAMFRPFLAIGTFGFGMISEAGLAYRFESPISVQALFEPIGVGIADDGNIVAIAGNIAVTYDRRMFEVGLGLGWSAVNNAIEGSTFGSTDAATGAGQDIEAGFDRVRSGLSVLQVARLGARDGLQLTVHNVFLFYHSEFHYGGTTGALQIPLGEKTALLLRGGGGAAGYGFGEIALRILLTGNGDRGSVFITPSLGGAGLFGEKEVDCKERWGYEPQDGEVCTEDISYGGPLVGIGLEWRF